MIDHRSILMDKADPKLVEFSSKLIPGGCPILGVRLPELRLLAKQIVKDDWRAFLDSDPTEYMEERMLQSMVISYAKMDIDERIVRTRKFVPIIDTWAVCDSFTYKAKKDERETYWELLRSFTEVPSEFGMRFGVVSMMGNFIDDEYIDRVLEVMDSTKHDGYYLKMGVAWAVSVCFVKFPEQTMTFLENNTLDDFTYNKSLQKIVESYRVSDETKTIIKGMKRRKK